VPAIVGLTPVDCGTSWPLGLQIEVERQYYSPQVLEGRIMTQLPLPGTKVRRDGNCAVARAWDRNAWQFRMLTNQSERAAE